VLNLIAIASPGWSNPLALSGIAAAAADIHTLNVCRPSLMSEA
jgi:hypothetical protein